MTSCRHLLAMILAVAAVPALVSPVLAGPRDDVKAGSARCDVFADERTWLDCYYGAAQPLRAKLGLPPAPASQQNLVPLPAPGGYAAAPAPRVSGGSAIENSVVTPSEREGPGFFTRLMTKTVEKPEPATRMTAYKFGADGQFTVTLANGEVWKQFNGDTVRAKWRSQPGNYIVTIEPGASLGERQMKVAKDATYQVVLVH